MLGTKMPIHLQVEKRIHNGRWRKVLLLAGWVVLGYYGMSYWDGFVNSSACSFIRHQRGALGFAGDDPELIWPKAS